MLAAPLPLSSMQENLETVSRNKLALLFDPVHFEVRPEPVRDKGIDLAIEIKQNGYYTNFRFAIQLKATNRAKVNKDGSRSISVQVSNINYLMNSGMPTYYVLYDAALDQFYCEPAAQVFQTLMKAYPQQKLPKQFSVRFQNLFTTVLIETIYNDTLESGMLLRKIMPKARQGKGLLVDEDNEVYTVEQNIAFIETFGYLLMNNKDFGRIIEIEQRTHPRTKASPMFNMICGISYYQRADLFKAIELLKEAQKGIDSLDQQGKTMVRYTLLHAKNLLGILSREDFKKAISAVMEDAQPNSFLQLERAHQAFETGIGNDIDLLCSYYEAVEQIIEDDIDVADVRIKGYSQLLSSTGKLMLHELTLNYSFTIGRKNDPLHSKISVEWNRLYQQHQQKLDALINFAIGQKNFMSTSNLILDKAKWTYRAIFHHYTFSHWDAGAQQVAGELDDADANALLAQIEVIGKVIQTYEVLHHWENKYFALLHKYQLQHLLDQLEECAVTAAQMHEIILEHELNGLKESYNSLINGDTEHEKFITIFTEKRRAIDQVAKNSGIEKFIYADISEEMSAILNRNTKWSVMDLPVFRFLSES